MPPKLTLTPEEKKALKAEKKAQKKLALIEKKKQLKRDVIIREVKYSNVTIKKYEREWKQMLVKIALPQMRDDLEFAWHNFERTIDCKDFTISLLMDELRFAERQYMMNFKNHVENIDRFIDMFNERLEELKNSHETDISNLRCQYEEDTEQTKSNFEQEEQHLKTIIHMLDVAEKTQKSNMRADYFSKIEEEGSKNSQNIQKMRVILETLQTDFQKNTQQFLETYQAQIKDRKKQYEAFRERDESMQILLLKQVEKLRRAYELIKRFKQNMTDTKKLLGRTLKDLEEEYNFFFNAFNLLKNRLILDRQRDAQKLEHLTVCYNEVNEYLEKTLSKGEQLLHIGAVCRKLETQEEKITPFPYFGIKTDSRITSEDPLIKDYISQLDLFFQRVGQAEALRYAINEEKNFLKTENRILMLKIHRYCQCLSCPNEQKNSNTTRQIKHITEGALEYQKYQKQGFDDFKGQVHFDDDYGEDDEYEEDEEGEEQNDE